LLAEDKADHAQVGQPPPHRDADPQIGNA